MKPRRLLGLLLAAAALFCLYGLLSTLEPSPRDPAPWRVGYATGFVALGALAICSLRS